ncbi:hypothetical protein D3C78_1761910 [compost metagenome]
MRQHDATTAHTHFGCGAGYPSKQDLWRGPGELDAVVVSRYPVAVVAQRFTFDRKL